MPNIPFIPDLLPLSREHDKWGEYNHLVGNAGVSLGKFDGLFAAAHAAPFGLMWLLREAQYSFPFFIRQLHNRLLEGRRGANKNPGSFHDGYFHFQ